jgi:hypothetical protein
MPITCETPIVIPASEEKTYNMWWIEKIYIDGNTNQEKRVSADVRLALCYLDEAGLPVFHPTERRRLIVDDFFALAAENQDAANVLGGIVNLVESVGKGHGIIT